MLLKECEIRDKIHHPIIKLLNYIDDDLKQCLNKSLILDIGFLAGSALDENISISVC
jgi:hypothetical protein